VGEEVIDFLKIVGIIAIVLVLFIIFGIFVLSPLLRGEPERKNGEE
jgi:hypothetical protein